MAGSDRKTVQELTRLAARIRKLAARGDGQGQDLAAMGLHRAAQLIEERAAAIALEIVLESADV